MEMSFNWFCLLVCTLNSLTLRLTVYLRNTILNSQICPYWYTIIDRYGGETSWEITNVGGEVVKRGEGYAPLTQYTEVECLPMDACTWTINDAWGDGMCCEFGEGGYVVQVNGEEIASGGEYGATESVDICAPTAAPSSAPSTKEPSLIPSSTPSTQEPSSAPSENSCSSLIQMTMDSDSQILQINIEGSDRKLRVKVVNGDFDLKII